MCVCSPSYPARKAHAPYRTVICGLFGSKILQHYLNNGIIFGRKMLLGIKPVFWFSLQCLSLNITHCKRNSTKHYHKYTKLFIYTVRCYSQILMKLQIHQQRFRKCSNYKISMKPHPVEAELFHEDGRTERRSQLSLFEILRTRINKAHSHVLTRFQNSSV